MANKHLQLRPHDLKNQPGYWYEEPAGIFVIIDGKTVGIRWSSIRVALKRKDKK